MGNQRLLQVSPSVRGHAALYFLKTFQETDGSLPITAAQRALLKTATHHLRRSKDRNYSTCPGIDGILKMMSLKQKFYADWLFWTTSHTSMSVSLPWIPRSTAWACAGLELLGR